MKTVQTLIDKASKACGSDAALARRMGIYPADISNLRAGKRALSPELAAEIADIAGEDARQAVIDAVIERNLTGKKGPLLKEILGKEIAAGEAAALGFSYKNALTYATETIAIVRNPSNVSIHRIYSTASEVIRRITYAVLVSTTGALRRSAPRRLPPVFQT